MNVRLACLALLAPVALRAQDASAWQMLERPRTNVPRPTSTAISVTDLRTRLFLLADDSMQGRLLGSPGNVKAVEYIAVEARRIGLEPAGDNGTYFQTVPVVDRSFNAATHVSAGDRSLEAWKDYVVRDQGAGARSVNGVPSIYAGVWGDDATLIAPADAAGKLVIVAARPDETGGGVPGIPNRPAVSARYPNAAGIAVVALDRIPAATLAAYRAPASGPKPENPAPVPSYLYITSQVASALLGTDVATARPGAIGRPLAGDPAFLEQAIPYPARNVVGILRGSDPTLRAEYVAIGAHNDHIGTISPPVAHDSMYILNHLFRQQGADGDDPKLEPADIARLNDALRDIRRRTNGASARLDSVYNGADDDGTGTVSVLELAEYFAGQKTRPKRSLLFVWHVGEEEGLWGSEYFTDHPTVPRDAIVTQLNIDMIGRGDATDVTGSTKDGKPIIGNDRYVQLVGSRRLSTELGDVVEAVNKKGGHGMALDYSLDANGHPQNIYCRSDHYSYARYAIPVVFFTTGGHADYHQVTDEPQYIDYDHMLRVVTFVRDIATDVANLGHRVPVDKPKPDPHGACRQ